jgi:hypothetical protein
LFTHSKREARFTLSQSAVNSIFLHSDQIFQIIASHKCIPILAFISENHLFDHILFNSFNFSCCFNADKQIFLDFSLSSQNTHHNAIIASHSYLLINHFSSIIISDISLKYSLRNQTNSSGENFSDIVVNHSISEKKIAIFLFSQSKFNFHSHDKISSATSFETYSDKALFNFDLRLFSTTYLIIFETVNDKIKAKKNSIE